MMLTSNTAGHLVDRQAHAVDADRSLRRHVAHQRLPATRTAGARSAHPGRRRSTVRRHRRARSPYGRPADRRRASSAPSLRAPRAQSVPSVVLLEGLARYVGMEMPPSTRVTVRQTPCDADAVADAQCVRDRARAASMASSRSPPLSRVEATRPVAITIPGEHRSRSFRPPGGPAVGRGTRMSLTSASNRATSHEYRKQRPSSCASRPASAVSGAASAPSSRGAT